MNELSIPPDAIVLPGLGPVQADPFFDDLDRAIESCNHRTMPAGPAFFGPDFLLRFSRHIGLVGSDEEILARFEKYWDGDMGMYVIGRTA